VPYPEVDLSSPARVLHSSSFSDFSTRAAFSVVDNVFLSCGEAESCYIK
jgi:hypothetical protein